MVKCLLLDSDTYLLLLDWTCPKNSSSDYKQSGFRIYSKDIPTRNTALKRMENRKSPGDDRISCEILKIGGRAIRKSLQIRLNKCLHEVKIPEAWQNAKAILLFDKEDSGDIENYRPVNLLPHTYKLLTKIDDYQTVGQAGFRKGFSTVDDLQTLKTLIEKKMNTMFPYTWCLCRCSILLRRGGSLKQCWMQA